MENNINVFLFALLREGLWRGDEDLPGAFSTKATARLFILAKQQAVAGIIFESLIRNNIKISKKSVFEAVALVGQIKKQNIVVNYGVCDLYDVFSSSDVKYVVVKGQTAASYYPDQLLRQSGDIDYFCDNYNFPLSQKAINQVWGVDGERNCSEKHVHFDRNGVMYEGHFELLDLYNKRKEDYWKRLLTEDSGTTVTIDGRQIKTLSPTLHVLYIFLHLYHHLMSLGVGLRQFCDMAVMLHYAKEEIDMSALRRNLHELGMEKAWKACGSILVDNLGLQEDELGFSLAKRDRRYGKKIMNVVLYRGNMGHYNKHNGFSGWKHKVEAMCIKVSHFIKFMPLAPTYSFGWLGHEMKRNL